MLSTWRLQLLVQFAALGTMRKVSESSCISMATVSQQLHLLEKETNLILFEKVGRHIRLTDDGLALVEKARPILNNLEVLETSIKDAAQEVRGTVRLSAFTSALLSLVVPVVSNLHDEYPEIDIRLTEREPYLSIPALESYQTDMAIISYSKKISLLEQRNTNCIYLGHDTLMVLVSDKDPLARQEKVRIEELRDRKWILEAGNTYLNSYIKELCYKADFVPCVDHEIQSYFLMHKMIAENMAIGILPNLAIIDSIPGIAKLKLVPMAPREMYLITRKEQTKAIKILTEAIRSYSSKLLIAH